MDSSTTSMNRRAFLKTTAVLGGSLIIGFNTSGALAATSTGSAPVDSVGFNPFGKIAPNGTVTSTVIATRIGRVI